MFNKTICFDAINKALKHFLRIPACVQFRVDRSAKLHTMLVYFKSFVG